VLQNVSPEHFIEALATSSVDLGEGSPWADLAEMFFARRHNLTIGPGSVHKHYFFMGKREMYSNVAVLTLDPIAPTPLQTDVLKMYDRVFGSTPDACQWLVQNGVRHDGHAPPTAAGVAKVLAVLAGFEPVRRRPWWKLWS